jgi:hypothetical protein
MEKFREALRALEVEAEKFDRRIGSGAVPMPSQEMIDELVDEVNDLREGLVRYRGPVTRKAAMPAPAAADTAPPGGRPGRNRTAALAPPKPADTP